MLFLEDPYRNLAIGAPCLQSVIEANDLRVKAIAAAQEAGSIPVGVHPRRTAGPHPVPLNVVATMNPEFGPVRQADQPPTTSSGRSGCGVIGVGVSRNEYRPAESRTGGHREPRKRSLAGVRQPERPDANPADQEILVRDEGRVRVVTLNRPERVNAFTASSYRRLASALDEADAAADVSVVLLEGAGRGFSSGVDLAAVGSVDETLAENFDQLIKSLITFSKPLLAAVHGAAVGFGATILLHCDLTLVAETARLRLPFTALGTTPEAASSVLLPQIVGAQRAADLILTSRWISGREAAQNGSGCSMLSRRISTFPGTGDRSGPHRAAGRSPSHGQAPFEGRDGGSCPRCPQPGAW